MFRDNRQFEWKASLWSALLAATIMVSVAGADEIELDNGSVFKGKVLKQTPKLVVFQREGDKRTIRFLKNRIVRMDIDGKAATSKNTPPPAGKNAIEPAKQSLASVISAINTIGPTKPDWWDSVELDYPDTLDLTGKNRVKGWKPKKNLGAYIHSVIQPNPSRWKSAIKLLHHVVEVRKADKPRQAHVMIWLGGAYSRWLADYQRAAYWLRQARTTGGGLRIGAATMLAEYYWKLGSKRLAIAELKKYGLDKKLHGAVIKLYDDMSMTGKALSMAKALAKRRPGEGNLLAGNIERKLGNNDKALAYYHRVLDTQKGSRQLKQYKKRAKVNIALTEALKKVDMASLTDGTYRGSGTGYDAPIDVKVTVKGGKIEAIAVTNARESRPYRSIKDIPTQIIKAQSLRIDAVTGATMTSNAVIMAVAKALAEGKRYPERAGAKEGKEVLELLK